MQPLTRDDPGAIAGYRIGGRLGTGGMGRVYLAFTEGGRPVALKVIRPELGDDPDFRHRFRQEIAAARRVHGLYTAQVLDANPDATPPWLVTAYVPGPSLQETVTSHGPMPPGTVLLLMAGVAEALQAIHHAGVVHRDLKPSNVLLAPDGPRVIDFGIAWAAEATAVTRTGIRVGSPQFMAPEQVSGVAVAPAIDVFSLGSLAAFAATGRPPFGEGGLEAVLYRVLHGDADLRGCPPPLRDLVERCLAKQPADRPAVADIVAESRRLAAGQGLQVSQSWLPASVAAALAQHAPPPVPMATVAPTATAAPPQAGPRPAAPPSISPQPAAPQAAAPQYAGPHPGWAAAPHPGSPYAGQPYAGGPYAGAPYGGQPYGGPPGGTTPLTSPAPVGPGSGPGRPPGPRPWTIIGIIAAVAAVAVLAVILLASRLHGKQHGDAGPTLNPSSHSSNPHRGGTTGRRSHPRPSASSPASSPPAARRWFSGVWLGTASQPTGEVTQWSMDLTFPATGKAGAFVLPTLHCSGLLLISGTGPGRVTLREVVLKNTQQLCAPGATITLTRSGPGEMRMNWQDAQNPVNVATGTLTRLGG
jgi:serine/threonine kinase PknH